ncbi:bifunctional acetaldehyde-CoA/alcohol dehydrogenase [Treponema phagedenis]|uniref:bifunctional acetaldehyde-CoA/alcohol dehydrogenase n=1 Tax=Treponema phagedenis TaxID=162 RepID=UPI0001F63A8E|nr:bifunctional acetaldehyde-CoA/alcohol dehydrogenase [Treponema phagedenis]EFW38859.1 aldehyde dehydrogenase (NAD) family protein [Treponema phagedenis F0421]TYT78732.1 bifunctional acetaldehyde-CoA/alcohol dehydrogenase [Treponema phagedenis]
MIVKTTEDLQILIERVQAAQREFSEFSQEQVDLIFRHAAQLANENRIALAKLAAEESGMGIFEDKVIKNHFAAEYIFNKYIHERTSGVISHDSAAGIVKIAEPLGVIAGIVPTTNPTSTAIFKSLIALKTRNGIVFSPHPRSKKSTIAAAKIILDAAVAVGAPKDIIGWIDEPSVELSAALMRHPKISLILATGGPGMVHAAYSSGTPAIGVGSGNTPAVIDETAHIKMAVSSILLSKTFDNGMICASEQSVIVVDSVYDAVKKEFLQRGAYFLSPAEKEKVGKTIIIDGVLNSAIVGQSAYRIAEMSGIKVPEETKVLIGESDTLERLEPFAHEKLSPVLGMFHAKNFEDACQKAEKQITLEGMGHTAVLYTNPQNHERINAFGGKMRTGRILVNMPASQGAIGDIYNFRLEPSLTLGCGSWGGNAISENVGVKHLMNIKTVAERRENMLWFQVPRKIYFKQNAVSEGLTDYADRKRAFIVTDKYLHDCGMVWQLTKTLDTLGIEHEIFSDVKPDPDLSTIYKGVDLMNSFKPDMVIAFGGGSPMDAAKIMRMLYEQPMVKFGELALRFMDIRKRVFKFPKLGSKAVLVAIPTTSGTGSEVTPFAIVTDDKTGVKYPIADYELTPDMAIIDPDFVLGLPKALTAYSGIDAIVHNIEAFVSVLATDFTNGLALESLRLIFKYLPAAYTEGEKNVKAREKMHYAATLAGMAFANAFLGVCHSMAHKIGAQHHTAHGLANALLISDVIRYNATEAPRKQAIFPQYKYPVALERYAKIADHLNLGGKTNEEKTEKLIEKIEEIKRICEIPEDFRATGIPEKDFLEHLDDMSEKAFDDQCTTANPRYPLVSEIRELYLKCYYGKDYKPTNPDIAKAIGAKPPAKPAKK